MLAAEAIYMQQLPGSKRAVVATQQGKMSLISIPPPGTKAPAAVLSTWLDLTPRVDSSQPERGLLSFAFHPNFIKNGRFFVSYICDANRNPDCKVRQGGLTPSHQRVAGSPAGICRPHSLSMSHAP